jgi:hypothetical protein
MGELVLFRQRAEPRRRIPIDASGAEILFFTGVRVVYGDPESEPPKTRSRRAAAGDETMRKPRDRARSRYGQTEPA